MRIRGAQGQEGNEASGRGGLSSAFEETEERDAEVDEEAERHQRDGDIRQEPAWVTHDLEDAEVLASTRAAETRLIKSHPAMAEGLIHRDIERERSTVVLDGDVAGEIARDFRSGILLVGKAI